MHTTILKYIAIGIGISLASSCGKKFIDKPYENGPTVDNYYKNADQVNAATGYLYNQVWSDYTQVAFHCIGEILGGNMLSSSGDPNYGNNSYVNFNVQATDGQNLNAWTSFYKVAGTSTVLMNAFTEKEATVSSKGYLEQGIGECYFMRAMAYFNLARVYGAVPIITDPVKLADSMSYDVPRFYQNDVLKFAINDLKNAIQRLPEDPFQAGRVTKYSAMGLMSKIYLYMKNYDSAAIMSKQVINSGKYALVSDYGKMFSDPNDNNNSESLFALQWIYSGGYSYSNSLQSYEAPAPLLKPDFGTGYSSVIPSIDLLNAYTFGDKRKSWSIMSQGYYNAQWTNVNFPNGFTYDTTWTSSLDDATKVKTITRTNALKYVVGPQSTGYGFDSQGGNSLCLYMLRYADILLIYAESIMGNNTQTTDANALQAFNLVHQRAGLTPLSVLTHDQLMHERRIEFAFEGDYFFDIQRQGFDKAKAILEAQERGGYNGDGTIGHVGVTITSPSQLYLPIPNSEIVADPKLAEDPVAYY